VAHPSKWFSLAETFLNSSEAITVPEFNASVQFFSGGDGPDYIIEKNTDNKNVLDLTSNKNKVILVADGGLFHINVDTLTLIGSLLFNTNYNIVINNRKIISDKKYIFTKNIDKYFEKVILAFNQKFNNRITVFNSLEYDAYKINNYSIINTGSYSASVTDAEQTFNYIKEVFGIAGSVATSNKKVYLSRKHILNRSPQDDNIKIVNDSFPRMTADIRIIDEDILEDFFRNNGFEIVCPEDFETIDDQIRYFSDVKTLVSTTSSGMANAIFMPNNSNIVELATSFILIMHETNNNQLTRSRIVELLHNQYGPLCYTLNQTYIRIPNKTRYANDIIDHINNNKSVADLLGIETN
jgi:hypothetical protein